MLLGDVALAVVSRQQLIQENNGVTLPPGSKTDLKGIPQNVDGRRLRVAND